MLCFLHYVCTCLSFSRSAWYERLTDESLGCAVRGGGVLPNLLHPLLPPSPLPLLFLRLAHNFLSFTPDTQLVSFLMGVLSDFFTLTTDSMMHRSPRDREGTTKLLLLWQMAGEHKMVFSFAHVVLLWQNKLRTVSRPVAAITQIETCQGQGRQSDKAQTHRLSQHTLSLAPAHKDYIHRWSACHLEERKVLKEKKETWKPHKNKKWQMSDSNILDRLFFTHYLFTHNINLHVRPVHSFLTYASGHSWPKAHSIKSW